MWIARVNQHTWYLFSLFKCIDSNFIFNRNIWTFMVICFYGLSGRIFQFFFFHYTIIQIFSTGQGVSKKLLLILFTLSAMNTCFFVVFTTCGLMLVLLWYFPFQCMLVLLRILCSNVLIVVNKGSYLQFVWIWWINNNN